MTVLSHIDHNSYARISVADNFVHCDVSGALYLPDDGVLVVSDLHLEKGSSFARKGAFLPPYDTWETLKKLKSALDRYEPKVVISLGDSFHDNDGLERMPYACRHQLNLLMRGREWYWVAGNHDPVLPQGLSGERVDTVAFGGLVFRHEPVIGEDAEVAGHLHPGARVIVRGQSLRRACFVSDGQRLVMPAFGSLTGNLNVLDQAFAGLFRAQDLRVYLLGKLRLYPIKAAMLRA